MPRHTDFPLRATVVTVLGATDRRMTFRQIQARTGASNWNLRMALDYLIGQGIVVKRGKKGVACEYWLSGLELDSAAHKDYDASVLMQVWR